MSSEGGRGDGADRLPAALPAASVSAVGLHGAVVQFTQDQDDWSEYVERLEHYFAANDISAPEKQRAMLLSAVGHHTYRIIRTLVSPDKVTDYTSSELVEKSRAHFNPKPKPIVKRFEFNTRCQGENEPVASYVAELRKIAEFCDYGGVFSDMLRDRIVHGTSSKAVQRRLLQEPDLTYEKALEIALSAETSEKDSKRLTGGTVDPPAIVELVKDRPTHRAGNKGQYCGRNNKPPKQQPSSQKGEDKECYVEVGITQLSVELGYTSVNSARRGDIWPKCAGKGRRVPAQSKHMWWKKESMRVYSSWAQAE